MASPIGYVPLGLVGFTDRGDYDPAATYMQNDLVHLGNSIWKCKVDETTGIDPEENANWTIFINSTTDLAGIMAVDGSGVLGSPGGIVVSQALIDAIAQKVMASIPVSKIVSNLLATDPTTVLAGSMGKVLDDKIVQLNSDLGLLKNDFVSGSFTIKSDQIAFNVPTAQYTIIKDTFTCFINISGTFKSDENVTISNFPFIFGNNGGTLSYQNIGFAPEIRCLGNAGQSTAFLWYLKDGGNYRLNRPNFGSSLIGNCYLILTGFIAK